MPRRFTNPQQYTSSKTRVAALRRRAKRAGYSMAASMCRRGHVGCHITGPWHIVLAGKGHRTNPIGIDDAERLLNEWIKEDG